VTATDPAGSPAGFERVWEPFRIGPVDVKHRLMYTAQTLLYAEDHILSDRHIAFYRERARGGCALMVTEQQAGHTISKGSFPVGCTAFERRVIPQYAKLADAVHEYGARQFVELFGAGVHDRGTMIFDHWHPLWSVSAVASNVHREMPMVMERDHIRDVVKGFGQSAHNVLASGLDGVEIHGAHSYLAGQFLSPAYNHRTDEYGGDAAGRCRFVLELGEEIRSRIGDEIALGLRLSYDEFLGADGITAEQTDETIELLAASDLFDYFSISGGGYHTVSKTVPPMGTEEGHLVPHARRAREIVDGRAAIFAVGRILSVGHAERVLTQGAADMVALTRAQLADPQLVNKSREGREDEITRCVGANVCLSRVFDHRAVTCVVNPAVGREREWGEGTLDTVAEARRVVVVGGGPSGMRLAATAATRGHDVTLLEADDELGGHLRVLRRFPSRASWGTAIENLVRPLAAAGVDVRLGERVSRDTVLALRPDIVVCATGSHYASTGQSPFRPGRLTAPGAEAGNVVDLFTAAERALQDPRALGDRVLIYDETGEYLPLGLADVLSADGVEVEVVCPDPQVGVDTHKTQDAPTLHPKLLRRGVRLTPNRILEAITPEGVELSDPWNVEHERREVDTVVLATLRTPETALYDDLRTVFPDVRRVGDAVAPRRLEAILYEAEKLARAL
jgi:2,4-dienoyl-CoA reductase-like NADH-dependent reductase (Old Yellow Enzyme family)